MTSWWCQGDAHGHHPLRREPPARPRRRRRGRRPRGQGRRRAARAGPRPGRPARPDGRPLAGRRRDHRRAPAGSVDVRLRGREPEFVVDVPTMPMPAAARARRPPTPPAAEDADEDDEDGALARITLRIPESVKYKAEELAAKGGHSLNSWIVNVVRAATRDRGRRQRRHRPLQHPVLRRPGLPARRPRARIQAHDRLGLSRPHQPHHPPPTDRHRRPGSRAHPRPRRGDTMQKTFTTPEPVSLHVELGSGDVVVDARDVDRDGGRGRRRARRGRRWSSSAATRSWSLAKPRRGGFFGCRRRPTCGSPLPHRQPARHQARLGRLSVPRAGSARRSLKTGSGDVRIEESPARPPSSRPARATSRWTAVDGAAAGQVRLRRRRRSTSSAAPPPSPPAPATSASTAPPARSLVKSGSGDLGVREAQRRRRAEHRAPATWSSTGRTAASSPPRTPPATSGSASPPASRCGPTSAASPASVRSDLQGAGEPEEGQDYIELRAKTGQRRRLPGAAVSASPGSGPSAPGDDADTEPPRSVPQGRSSARRTPPRQLEETTTTHVPTERKPPCLSSATSPSGSPPADRRAGRHRPAVPRPRAVPAARAARPRPPPAPDGRPPRRVTG